MLGLGFWVYSSEFNTRVRGVRARKILQLGLLCNYITIGVHMHMLCQVGVGIKVRTPFRVK